MQDFMLVNPQSGEKMVFDDRKFVLSRLDEGAVSLSRTVHKGHRQIGAVPVASTLDQREVVFEGYLFAFDDMQLSEYKRMLARVCAQLQSFEIHRGGRKLVCVLQKMPQYDADAAFAESHAAHFTVYAVSYAPFWKDQHPTQVGYSMTYTGALTFPSAFVSGGIVLGMRTPSLVLRTENKGDFPCGAEFTIASDLPITFVEIRHVRDGAFFRLDYPLNQGMRVCVDTRYGEKGAWLLNKNGEKEENILWAMHPQSTFLQIPQGKSLFDVIVGGNASGVVSQLRFEKMYW